MKDQNKYLGTLTLRTCPVCIMDTPGPWLHKFPRPSQIRDHRARPANFDQPDHTACMRPQSQRKQAQSACNTNKSTSKVDHLLDGATFCMHRNWAHRQAESKYLPPGLEQEPSTWGVFIQPRSLLTRHNLDHCQR